MRPAYLLAGLLFAASATGQVLINELQCARAEGTDGKGPHGDWVELFNAGSVPVDLGGYILALGMRTERIRPGVTIGPGQHRVLWCDRGSGPDHLDLKLPRKGGSLLLVAPDGTQVLDLFRWPALPSGIAMGRASDGGREWGVTPTPTPGAPNAGMLPRLLPGPVITELGGRLVIDAPDGAEVRFTMNGSVAGPEAERYTGPLHVHPGAAVRARAYAPDALVSGETVWTTALPDSAWAVVIAPEELSGPNGIEDTLHGNHARKGKDWRRQAWVQHDGQVWPVGLSIAGSGSRSLPKRNFKLIAHKRYNAADPIGLPDGTRWREVLLRADASPDAFLRNAFMEEAARRSGNRVDVQASSAVPLYFNGDFHGLYRAMPTKGNEWLRSKDQGGPVEIVEGPAAVAVKGNAKGYRRALHALQDGLPVDSLERLMDVESLVELACFDLWTGRADHELNVRAWRPRRPDGRWRWVLYDMDMWAPPDDRTVRRMLGTAVPEAPFLEQIRAHPVLKQRLLARMAALCATTFHPEQALPLVDSLFARNRRLMQLDHERWKGRMPMTPPDRSAEALRDHVARRSPELLQQLAAWSDGRLHALTVRVEPAGSGRVEVEGLSFTDGRKTMQVFGRVPLHMQAVAREGMEFVGWKGVDGDPAGLVLVPRSDRQLVAVFRPVGLSGQGRLQQRLEQHPPVGIAE